MKKLIFSILIASFAIQVSATIPLDKLPAIVIDTIYVSSGALVVEYEVLRPFDQISLSVKSNRSMSLNDAKPVLLSGNTGKRKTSLPVSLKADQATYFNVFLSGGEFLNKADTVDYQSNGYDYAIFRKQKDNTVKQFRTQYTEEEKSLVEKQIKDKAFVRSGSQFNGINFSDSTKRSVIERYDDPLAVDTYEIKAVSMHQDDSINGSLRAGKNYLINISGHVKTQTAANGWNTYIPETDVFLLFKSRNTSDLIYFCDSSAPCTLFEGVQYSRTDASGNFNFNFSIDADLMTYLNIYEAVVFVARDNEYVSLNVPGTTLYYNCNIAVPVFLDGDDSKIAINNLLSGTYVSNKEIIVDNIRMASSLGMFWYAGNMLNQLNWQISGISVYETKSTDYGGQFNSFSLKINLSNKVDFNTYNMHATPAHEYGHFVNYMLWGAPLIYTGKTKTKESFAMFYSYAARHYAYKNGFSASGTIFSLNGNLDVGPFTTPKFNNWFSYPDYAKWSSYLWELFDGHSTFQAVNSDNDDIAMPWRVIQTWCNIGDINDFHSAFKAGLSAEEKASIDGIYNFTVGGQTTGMRSQKFNSSSLNTTSDGLVVNLTYQPYGMASYFSENIRNSPTSFRIYGQRFTNCSWVLIGEIPYNATQTTYSQSFIIHNSTLYNYKMLVHNAGGESAYPHLLTHHNNSGICPTPDIDGPNTVCFDGSSFTLINYPTNVLTWTVTGPFSFSSTSSVTSTTDLSPTVYRTTASDLSGTLSVYSSTGSSITSKMITPCTTFISGNNTVCCNGSTFTLQNPPSGVIKWEVTGPFTVSPSTGNSTTITYTEASNDAGVVKAKIGNTEIAIKGISPCAPIYNVTNRTISQNTNWRIPDNFGGNGCIINIWDITVNAPLTINITEGYIINIWNIIVNAPLTIKFEGVLNIQDNVTIGSAGNLIFEPMNGGRVVIDDKFDLSAGGFEIK